MEDGRYERQVLMCEPKERRTSQINYTHFGAGKGEGFNMCSKNII
jgi:hypothetical protein